MKLLKILFPVFLLSVLCMNTGCDDEKDTHYTYVNVPLGSHDVMLREQQTLDVAIGIPSSSYRVESDNPNVVTAELVDGAIRLTGVAVGTTMIHLSDDAYNRARMSVEVKKLFDLTLESIPGGLDVLRLDNDGSTKELKILTGNDGYTAVSSAPTAVGAMVVEDPDVAGGSKLVLTGLSNTDAATVTVTDSRGKTATVSVRVTNPLMPIIFDTNGPLTGEYVYQGTPEQLTFGITSGNGGYTVLSSNEGVATVALSGQTVTVTVVGDGAATITVLDREKESRSIDLWVPLNTDDPMPRISWDGYRADLSTPGTSVLAINVNNPKTMYWYQERDGGTTDSWYVTFNGGWSLGLECVGATNRKPGLEVTVDGVKTAYNDQNSEVRLTSLFLLKQITPIDEQQRIYFVTLKTDDGKEGFIVYPWNN